jgi:DNA-directed RNA polymerase subunit RPC12/RpoP
MTVCKNDATKLIYCADCEQKKNEHQKSWKEDRIEEGCFENEEDITCPYCGYKDKNSWEAPDEDDDYTCGNCNETFAMQRIITVEYSTWRNDSEVSK